MDILFKPLFLAAAAGETPRQQDAQPEKSRNVPPPCSCVNRLECNAFHPIASEARQGGISPRRPPPNFSLSYF
jgi:hypothetical protein